MSKETFDSVMYILTSGCLGISFLLLIFTTLAAFFLLSKEWQEYKEKKMEMRERSIRTKKQK